MKTKMNIFKQYFFAITNPKKYQEMTKLGSGRVFLYLLLLSIITTVIALAGPVKTYFDLGGLTGIVDDYIPEFHLSNDTFKTNMKFDDTYSMEEFVNNEDFEDFSSKEIAEELQPYIFYIFAKEFSMVDMTTMDVDTTAVQEEVMESDFYLYTDTSVDTVADVLTSKEIPYNDVDDIVILTKHEFMVLDSSEYEDITSVEDIPSISYGEFFTEDISLSTDEISDVISKMLPMFYVIFAVVVVFIIIFTLIGWVFAGLIYSLIALIVNSITKKQIPYGSLFKIAIYSQTTAIILKTILSYFSVPTYALTYGGYVITIVYIVFAIVTTEKPQNIPFNGGMYNYNNMNANYQQDGYNQVQQNYGQTDNYNNQTQQTDQQADYNQVQSDNQQPNNTTQPDDNDTWTSV